MMSPAAVENTVLPAFRFDLIVSKQVFEGRDFYVIKDPISLTYFRLSDEDYFLATQFDGERSFAEVRENFVRRFPHLRLALSAEQLNERIVRFANELAMTQFVRVRGESARQRANIHRKTRRGRGFSSFFGRVFYFRFSLFDPDELFARMVKPLWWIWTKTTLWVSIGLIIAAVFVFLNNVGRIAPTMNGMFSLHNLVLLWIGTILVKVVHELGHGLTCKHFGGEVHEIGVMMMLLHPFFYVNASDCWMMPERRHRILVTVAGIYVELIIAAIATFFWAVSQPGILQQVLFNIMVVTSIFTIFVNANPLMRFDGYYIATDLLEVPNLRTKSRAYISYLVQRGIFGRSTSTVLSTMALPKQRFSLFLIYAICSYSYSLLVLYKMTRIFVGLLTPFGMEELGRILSWMVIVAFIVMPFVNFLSSLKISAVDWQPGGRMRRLGMVAGTALALFVGSCFVPIQHTIERSSAIEVTEPDMIRPETAGMVEELYVKEGDLVKTGDAIAKLSNRQVTQTYEIARLQSQMADKLLQQAMATDRLVEYRKAGSQKEQSEVAMREAEHELNNLVLRAKEDGIVLTHALEKKKGTMIAAGGLLCQISPLKTMLIKIPLSESEVRYVEPGQKVHLKAFARPEVLLNGVIAQKPLTFLSKDISPNLSSTRNGDVPTTADGEGHEVPAERTYNTYIKLNNADAIFRPGMTGRVKIYTGVEPIGKLVIQSAIDLISLDYRL